MSKKDPQILWSSCLAQIKTKVPAQTFRTWFAPLVPYKFQGDTLTLAIPNLVFYEWIESHYADLLREVVHQEIGPKGRLSYQVVEKTKKNTPTKKTDKKKSEKPTPPRIVRIRPNPLYTFDNFVVGDGNELAQAACLAVATQPGKTSFNPLLIHSPVGLGKTHLLHAIVHEILKENPEAAYIYTTAENFTAEFVKSLRTHQLENFLAAHEGADILLMDDIQFLAGKEKTQDIFFNIFNHLYQCGKQIVMTSDRPPSDLVGFPRRLISRFGCGLTTKMSKPDLETRIAIVESKLSQHNFLLHSSFIFRIAEVVTTSVREIEGAVTSLIGYSSLNKKEINAKLVEQVIQGVEKEVETPPFDMKSLQKTVADHYKVPLESLKGKARNREVATARHVAMYLARTFMPDATLQSIGHHFGRRDHSTVSYGIRSIESLRSTDKQLRKSIEDLKKQIKLQKGGH